MIDELERNIAELERRLDELERLIELERIFAGVRAVRATWLDMVHRSRFLLEVYRPVLVGDHAREYVLALDSRAFDGHVYDVGRATVYGEHGMHPNGRVIFMDACKRMGSFEDALQIDGVPR